MEISSNSDNNLDLNMDLNDGNDLVDNNCVKKEPIIDLNMDVDDNDNDDDDENKNEDVDLGGYVNVKKVENSSEDVEEIRMEDVLGFGNGNGNVSENEMNIVSPKREDVMDGSLGKGYVGGRRGRKRKVTESPKTPVESVLRRSARRRAKLSMEEEEAKTIKFDVDNSVVLPSAPSPVISAVSEERPTGSGCEESEEPNILPLKPELPPMKGNLNLDGLPVLDLFSVYAFLRSFSTILFLSPFGLGDFVASIRSKSPSLLIDSIHVSLLRIVRKNLEFQSSENITSATSCLRDLNWDLLDLITWPIFMAEYLLMKADFDLDRLKLFKTDYYEQSELLKIELLQYICDDVIQNEAISSELNRRIVVGESTNVIDSGLNTKMATPKKRRLTMATGEEVIDGNADWNSDECCLCKMDGNLICCDGCPAAYHSKCVGIATNLLPEGDWYCPECVVDKKNPEVHVAKSIRGADLLGVDPHGRLYYSSCGYLLVSDTETSFHYYHMDDLTDVINTLNLSNGSYRAISRAITKHWRSYTKLYGEKSKLNSENASLCVDPLLKTATKSASELSEAVTGTKSSLKTRRRSLNASSGVVGKNVDSSNNDIELPKKRKGLSRQLEMDYLNYYSFARVASSVAGEWTRKPSDKISQTPTKSLGELISIQMKSIMKTSVDFCWSNIPSLSVDARKEKCGWCLACKFPTDDGNCLFFMNNPTDVESFTSDLLGFDSSISRKDRLRDVMCHILYIEDRLHGLLLGPWLSPQFPKRYRKSVLEASDIVPIRDLLLMLESNIWSRALSDDWLKHVDSVKTVGSASHIITSKLRMQSQNVIGKKRSTSGLQPHSFKSAFSGLTMFWWRGGRLTRKVFNWKVLPRSLACKAARQGGGKKIDDLLYLENSDYPKRSKALAWRASVESAVTVEQLALQIRELDANIKWEEIENTSHLAKMDKESLKTMRSFKKAIVRRKTSEGAVVKYLLDFGKRRFIPDAVVKHGSKIEEASSERKKYWVEQPYIPLFLLKPFEDKRISLKSNKLSLSSLPVNIRAIRPAEKDVFSYLLSKAENSENHLCGHCNKDVLIRNAVSCRYCEGFFHKGHVRKTTGGTYTCHKCHVGGTVKSIPKKGKSHSWKAKKASKITKKGGKGKQLVQPQAKNKGFVVPLRRSARTAKIVSVQSKKKPMKKKNKYGSKKKQQLKSTVVEVATPKNKRGRPRKIMKTSFRKKRTHMNATYWLNGLRLSRKPDDKRVTHFKAKNHLLPSELLDSIIGKPTCCLCHEPEFRSSLNYVNCDTCRDWYHGDAFGLTDEHIGVVIGFKCHKCRERAPPICPHLNSISDETQLVEQKNDEGTKSANKLSSEVIVKQESNTIKEQNDLLSKEASPKQQNGHGSKEDHVEDVKNGFISEEDCAEDTHIVSGSGPEDALIELENGHECKEDCEEDAQDGSNSEEEHAEGTQNGPNSGPADALIEVENESLQVHDESCAEVAPNGSLKAK